MKVHSPINKLGVAGGAPAKNASPLNSVLSQSNSFNSFPNNSLSQKNNAVAFKGIFPNKLLYKTSFYEHTEDVLKIFAKYLGNAGDELLETLKKGIVVNNKVEGTIVSTVHDKKLGDAISEFIALQANKKGEGKLTGEANKVLENFVNNSDSRIIIVGDKICVKEKTFFNSLIDNIAYPIKEIPHTLADGCLTLLQKVPFLKESATKLYNSAPLTRARNKALADEQINMFQGILGNTLKTLKDSAKSKNIGEKDFKDFLQSLINSDSLDNDIHMKLFRRANKQFGAKSGNYNTVHERSLNRLVTGLIPAIFLANDAYNLSVLCGDSKKTSDAEKKTRFDQEVTRVCTNAYLQLITLGALTKFVNSNPLNSALVTSITVLFSETLSRLTNGRAPYFISAQKAHEMNQREAQKQGKSPNQSSPNSATQPIKTSNVSNNLINNAVPAAAPTTSVKFGDASNDDKKSEVKKSDKSTVMSFDTLKKALTFVVGGGFALGYLKNSRRFNGINLKIKFREGGKVSKFVSNTRDIIDDNFRTMKLSDFFKKANIDISNRTIDNLDFQKHTVKDLMDLQVGSVKQTYGFSNRLSALFKPFKDFYGRISKSDFELDRGKFNSSMEFLDKHSPDLSKVYRNIVNNSGMPNESKLIKFVDKKKTAERLQPKIVQEAIEAAQEAAKAEAVLQGKSSAEIEKIVDDAARTVKLDYNVYMGVNSKVKPFADLVFEPFKFMWGAVCLPYKLIKSITKAAMNSIADSMVKDKKPTKLGETIRNISDDFFGKIEAKKEDSIESIFMQSMDKIMKKSDSISTRTQPLKIQLKALEDKLKLATKQEEITNIQETITGLAKQILDIEKEFGDYVKKSIQGSFNGISKSGYSNTDLAMLTKLVSSVITSYFLVADNYNMVMIKSDGKDKDGSFQKAQERVVQRLSAIFYQTMFMNWFNSVFHVPYHSSLTGMAAVCGANTVATEVFTRGSIGMPLGSKTYDELVAIDEKNNSRKGFLGSYFRFMTKLTGKKPLANKNKPAQISTPDKSTNTNIPVSSTPANKKTTNLLEIYGVAKA